MVSMCVIYVCMLSEYHFREIKHKSTNNNDKAKPKTKKRERKATNDLKLLSFGDDEQAFQQEVRKASGNAKRSKKLMSSHDLLNDKKLNAKVDDALLQTIAASTATDASAANGASGSDARAAAAKKEAVRASLKAAVAAAAAGKRPEDSGASTETPPEAEAGTESETVAITGTSSTGGTQDDDQDAAARRRKDAKRASKAAASAEQDEYARLREELRATKKAAPVRLGSKDAAAAAPVDDMLTPLQQQRQKYLQQKRASSRSGRQEATLQKLQQFRATLEGVNRTQRSDGDDNQETDAKRATQDAYHGQVLDSDSDSGEQDADAGGDSAAGSKTPDLSWMTAKLKFKKHIDVRPRGTLCGCDALSR